MPKIYNRRDILQECSKQINTIRHGADNKPLQWHLVNIYQMISKLAEYKNEPPQYN